MINEFKPILMRNFNTNNLESKGLSKVINLSSQEIIDRIEKIQLKECGVYSESVADKWKKIISAPKNEEKKLITGFNNIDNSYVSICLLENDPANVFGGMAILGRAVDISKGVLYIPEEKANLKEVLENRIKEIELFGFEVEIAIGKIDVRQVEDYDLVHHIDTMASIAAYFDVEEEYVPSKIVSVTGAVKKPGVGEIPENTNVIAIVEKISGGFEGEIQAIVLGGKSGKCIAESEAEKTIFEGNSTNEIIALNKTECIVDFAKQGIIKMYEGTCGKCTFCREGLYQLKQMISDATEGKGKAEDLELIEEIANEVSEETLCSYGQKSTEFVKTSMLLFKSNYESHIKRKKCPVDLCGNSQNIAIKGDICDGCGECVDVCDFDAIEGKSGYIHMIDEFDCTKCGKCIDICPVSAIVKILGNKAVGPDKLTRVGKWKKRR
ncbi:hypothetical protein psyc5s11_10490 [Clostridium gelidum]|uniref:4Fe-4S ferredoxin-type domain-containing protein n=1 Tax=Clostridium gelidum TaxID=704125 RepID=A0ABN6ISM3_9CLOT|nr:NADH-ubiquinone oxidoreductase-F iron-sulfur binding region domain-containing protein [Clostridium gelidum]BCZ44982.1 hypothetical protein psyc5s11_10490 [Clostridium gelidum]